MGLDPPYLADRTAQLARFDQYLTGFPVFPRNVRLTGLRGVGKTVLLQHYAALAEDRGWVVVRRECSEHLQGESTFALALVEDCRRAVEHSSRSGALRVRSSTAARRALDLLGSLTISLEGVTLAVKPLTVAVRQPGLLEDRLFQALELACEGAVEGRRPGVLLCYDEAHVLHDTPRRRDFPLGLFLASVAHAQREGLPVMLVACGLPTLTDNLARAKSYSERMFQAEKLDALHPREATLAFARPLEAGDRRADDDVIAAVLKDTGGYPFHIQFVPPWKRRVIRVSCNYSPTACRSRLRKLRAVRPWKRRDWMGAALTTTGRVGTTRRLGSGKQDGKVYERRNQWWNPLKGKTGSNLVDMGRATVRVESVLEETTLLDRESCGREGHGESLRRNRGEAVGEKLDTASVNRHTLNMGTSSAPPSPPLCQSGGGQARCWLMTPTRGGGSVVVRGWESQPHGEGTQRDRSAVTGMPGGRR